MSVVPVGASLLPASSAQTTAERTRAGWRLELERALWQQRMSYQRSERGEPDASSQREIVHFSPHSRGPLPEKAGADNPERPPSIQPPAASLAREGADSLHSDTHGARLTLQPACIAGLPQAPSSSPGGPAGGRVDEEGPIARLLLSRAAEPWPLRHVQVFASGGEATVWIRDAALDSVDRLAAALRRQLEQLGLKVKAVFLNGRPLEKPDEPA